MPSGTIPVESLYRAIGLRVRARRLLLGWRQRDLAERSGVNRQVIANIEGGRQRVYLHTALALAGALGGSVGDLVERAPTERWSMAVYRERLAERNKGAVHG